MDMLSVKVLKYYKEITRREYEEEKEIWKEMGCFITISALGERK